jgi:hypothetical protein
MSPMKRRYDAEQYPGLLTADPPVCASGPPLAALRRCERLRRGEACWCRIYSRQLADDLCDVGASAQAEYLTQSLEPEDLEALVGELRALSLDRVRDAELRGRVEAAIEQLSRLVRHGAGLTDLYSDDLD